MVNHNTEVSGDAIVPTVQEVERAFVEYQHVYYAQRSTSEEVLTAYKKWIILARACPAWGKEFGWR